jgi:acetylornithine deacetylase/succinyl-diaminopimelate desuccinylase-like protein
VQAIVSHAGAGVIFCALLASKELNLNFETHTVSSHLMERKQSAIAMLEAFLRHQSVSTNPAYDDGMAGARRFLLDYLQDLGLPDARLLDAGGKPAVFASWTGAPGKPTILVYGHYDIQPAEPIEAWRTPPFEPTREGDLLYGRGASDVKGSTVIALEVVGAFLKLYGACPLNIKILIEGEEEIGSPTLTALLKKHERILRSDAVLSADGGRAHETIPTLNVGARGMATFEVHVTTASTEVHSGRYGGAIRNAVHELARMITSLHDDTGRVAVSTFLAGARKPSPHARGDSARLPFDSDEFVSAIGGILHGDPACSVRERVTLYPAIDINGVSGGYTGSGSKTVIPATAFAKISLRMVPGQDPGKAVSAVKNHLLAVAASDVKVDFIDTGGASPASSLSKDGALYRCARQVLHEVYGQEPIDVRIGPSVPITALFHQFMGIETLMFGLNLPDENVHAPNEFFHLTAFDAGFKTWPALLCRLGQMTPSDFKRTRHEAP